MGKCSVANVLNLHESLNIKSLFKAPIKKIKVSHFLCTVRTTNFKRISQTGGSQGPCVIRPFNFRLRWRSIVFLACEARVQMARAREYLKKRKTKINMAARLLSRVAFHLPLSFLSRTNLHRKTLRNMLENTLLSSSPDVVKLMSQFAVFVAPTSEREDGRDRTRRKSQRSHGALFMVGGFALSSMIDETPKKAGVSSEVQPTREKQPLVRDEKGRFSQKKPTRRGNTTIGLVG